MTFALVRYDAARKAVSECRRVDEAKEIRDKAQALAAYARQANDTELLEWVTEIKVRAERKAGELLREVERSKGGGQRTSAILAPVLATQQIPKTTAARWQKLAAVPESKFEQAVAAAKEVAGEVTTAALLRLNGAHPGHNSGDNEWYTPEPYITAARATLGEIDLDPASTKDANSVVQATRFYTAEQDGLTRKWHGRVWLNPPYAAPLIGPFMEKLRTSYTTGDITAAISLTNNATETAWFGDAADAASALCLPRSRVKFWHPRKQAVPLQGQAVLYFGPEPKVFVKHFAPLGSVWMAYAAR